MQGVNQREEIDGSTGAFSPYPDRQDTIELLTLRALPAGHISLRNRCKDKCHGIPTRLEMMVGQETGSAEAQPRSVTCLAEYTLQRNPLCILAGALVEPR